MAVLAEGTNGRVYLPSNAEQELATQVQPSWKPTTLLPEQALGFRIQAYGLTHHADLFTPRQLKTLTTFVDLIKQFQTKIYLDAINAGMSSDDTKLEKGGIGAKSYSEAIVVYLSCALSRLASYNNTICFWNVKGGSITQIFARHAISMSWDFIETNPLQKMSGNWQGSIDWVSDVVENLNYQNVGSVIQMDARNFTLEKQSCISTDPPYYDAIGYADLSDFFYIWLKECLDKIFPTTFGTLLTPKTQELIATPYRFDGSKKKAQNFFENGLAQSFSRMREFQHPDFPLTVYYAFKQTESDAGDEETGGNESVIASTGWETMLEALISAGFAINGTLPMRTERAGRPRDIGSNALASSIVLVCRPRPETAATGTRGEFLRELKRELPDALRRLQEGNIAPVDLAQASIGPGMAVYSRYKQVVESDGAPMRVRTALGIINQILDEVLAEQDSEYDSETRWAIDWFAQFGMNTGAYGDAETLSKAKNTSVAGMETAGIISSRAGKVKLLSRDELKPDWNPDTDSRLTVWEITQHLIRALENDGEQAAARLLQKDSIGYLGDIAKELAYRLYNFCERKGWAQEALAYNSLVVSWNDIQKQASELANNQAATQSAFDFE